jgi:hypothetical protein
VVGRRCRDRLAIVRILASTVDFTMTLKTWLNRLFVPTPASPVPEPLAELPLDRPIYIDFPGGRRIATAVEHIGGWFPATPDEPDPVFTLGGRTVPGYRMPRPDLDPDGARGFCIYFSLADHLDAVRDGRLRFILSLGGRPVSGFDLAADDAALRAAARLPAERAGKRRWLMEHVRCPACHRPSLSSGESGIACASCGRTDRQQGYQALNLLDGALSAAAELTGRTDEVCGHGYDAAMTGVVERAVATGGMVLDAGAGLRRRGHPSVVALDIFDYPSTDVRADALDLPFRDASFDAVISSATIEHVRDPFAYARELVRVLRPGGTLYCAAPFLVPEHGFPDHYFNVTRSGLRHLFEHEIAIDTHEINSPNEPIYRKGG